MVLAIFEGIHLFWKGFSFCWKGFLFFGRGSSVFLEGIHSFLNFHLVCADGIAVRLCPLFRSLCAGLTRI